MHEGLRLKTSGGFLLDTNILLWILLNKEEKISRRALKIVRAEQGLHVSFISVWEILLKRHAGKLMVEEDPDTIIEAIRSQDIWRILPLEFEHLYAVNAIDRFTDHTDPFDRMLIAQARAEGLRIITPDKQFSRYKVEVVW